MKSEIKSLDPGVPYFEQIPKCHLKFFKGMGQFYSINLNDLLMLSKASLIIHNNKKFSKDYSDYVKVAIP